LGKQCFSKILIKFGRESEGFIIRLTLSEKAVLMCDQSDAIPRLGIKKFNWWSEALPWSRQ